MFVEKKVKLYPLHEGNKIFHCRARPEEGFHKRVADKK